MSELVMHGVEDLTGRRFGKITIHDIATRRPLFWHVACTTCGATWREAHATVRHGLCRNATCGRETLLPARKPGAMAQTGAAFPKVRSRDSASAREYERELEGQERQTAKLREQEQLQAKEEQRTAKHQDRKLAWRDLVANGQDPLFRVDPETAKPIPTKDVPGWQKRQFEIFTRNNPNYFRCDENANAIVAYLDRNAPDIKLVSAQQLTWAFKRLSEFALLKTAPDPHEQPASPIPRETATEQSKSHDTELIDGWDLDSGEPRKWSTRELDRLSSDDYRRALHLDRDRLSLPNIGPGPRPR